MDQKGVAFITKLGVLTVSETGTTAWSMLESEVKERRVAADVFNRTKLPQTCCGLRLNR
jgi:hypothetical protein